MSPQSLINWSEMNMQNVFEQDHRTQKLTTDSKINKWYKFDLVRMQTTQGEAVSVRTYIATNSTS